MERIEEGETVVPDQPVTDMIFPLGTAASARQVWLGGGTLADRPPIGHPDYGQNQVGFEDRHKGHIGGSWD